MSKVKKAIKKMIDYEAVKEISMTMDNEGDVYAKEGLIAKNYARKLKRGKFDFSKAHKGALNLSVTPFVRSYENKFGMKVGRSERDAIAKNRLRTMLRRIRENEF